MRDERVTSTGAAPAVSGAAAGAHAGGYDFYVAGPFFTPGQVASMERLEAVLKAHGRSMFRPRMTSDVRVVGPRACYEEDLAAIRASAAVIANLVDDDPGTMMEIGFATGRGVPVYGYREGLRDGDSVNLMIVQAVRALFRGPADLDLWLSAGERRDPEVMQF
ncbi:nucleoside 2-deoxyribosyltransferase [uncultured Bifidobacterium sp.]|uniref:nucleoside 2-deoxyribosyltransferase n=1 Tax=uncultured Bifidobacterium sp. TaxID=165187 RepID=UPI0028DC5993|nr:nucleoside 2-deoxyribosyltransferase [uncultured Bifidobacterium sp.]